MNMSRSKSAVIPAQPGFSVALFDGLVNGRQSAVLIPVIAWNILRSDDQEVEPRPITATDGEYSLGAESEGAALAMPDGRVSDCKGRYFPGIGDWIEYEVQRLTDLGVY